MIHVTCRRGTSAGREGVAMLLVIGILAILMTGLTAFYGLLHLTLSQANNREHNRVCFNLAEAGIDKAAASLKLHPGDYQGEKDAPLGRGFFTVEVARATNGDCRIASTGFLRDDGHVLAKVCLAAEVSLGPDGAIRAFRWSEDHP